ncbi:MAG TPA: hypothetical protein VNM45_22070 [Bacillus sp. (in: firmicutes)]|nr:hypothetical protein [Bacillus sp. (in: firmicutes)]
MIKEHDARKGLRSSSLIIYLTGAEPLFLIVFVPYCPAAKAKPYGCFTSSCGVKKRLLLRSSNILSV